MKTDARVRYTRMRIRDAFLSCLAEKPVSKITVKEICDLAEINRATFYKHYADSFDLLEKLEDEALAWLEKAISEDAPRQDVLRMVLDRLSGTDNPYGAVASANGDPGFAARISALFYREFRPQLAQSLPGRTEEERTAAYFFVVGGCSHLLAKWMQEGRKTPPEVVAEKLEAMTAAFVRAYGEKSRESAGNDPST